MVMILLSAAKYLQKGQSVEIEENGGLLDAATSMDFLPGFSLEGDCRTIFTFTIS